MAQGRPQQICPICHAKHDEPVGVTRPTCGKPDCIRALRKQGPLGILPPSTRAAPTPTKPKKPRKPRKPRKPKKPKHD